MAAVAAPPRHATPRRHRDTGQTEQRYATPHNSIIQKARFIPSRVPDSPRRGVKLTRVYDGT